MVISVFQTMTNKLITDILVQRISKDLTCSLFNKTTPYQVEQIYKINKSQLKSLVTISQQ